MFPLISKVISQICLIGEIIKKDTQYLSSKYELRNDIRSQKINGLLLTTFRQVKKSCYHYCDFGKVFPSNRGDI